eukprot:4523166-Amphidinium_carterae.1
MLNQANLYATPVSRQKTPKWGNHNMRYQTDWPLRILFANTGAHEAVRFSTLLSKAVLLSQRIKSVIMMEMFCKVQPSGDKCNMLHMFQLRAATIPMLNECILNFTEKI